MAGTEAVSSHNDVLFRAKLLHKAGLEHGRSAGEVRTLVRLALEF